MARTPDGTLHAVYRRKIGLEYHGIWARSIDGGLTWTEESVGTSTLYISLTSDSAGDIWITTTNYPGPGLVKLYRQRYQSPGVWDPIGSGYEWQPFTLGYGCTLLRDETHDRLHIMSYAGETRHRSLKVSTNFLGPVTIRVIHDWQYPQMSLHSDGSGKIWLLGQTYADPYAYANLGTPVGGEAWSWDYPEGSPSSGFSYSFGSSNHGVKARKVDEKLVALRALPGDLLRVEREDEDSYDTGLWSQYDLDTSPYGGSEVSSAWWRKTSDLTIEAIWWPPSGAHPYKATFNLGSGLWGTPMEDTTITGLLTSHRIVGDDGDAGDLWLWMDQGHAGESHRILLEGVGLLGESNRPWWIGRLP